jgi:hypothetical protein
MNTPTETTDLLPAEPPGELIAASPTEQRAVAYPSMVLDMPSAEYHSRPEISSHDLGRILEAPAKYLHGKTHPKDATPAELQKIVEKLRDTKRAISDEGIPE